MKRSISAAGFSVLMCTVALAESARAPLAAQTHISQVGSGTVRVERVAVERQSTGRRVALVIGNSKYQTGNQLPNPVNDAQDMASTLQSLGFEVILRTDSSRRQMREALDLFSSAIDQGTVGVFYYAGHGVQSNGENYLIPVDANITVEQDLPDEAMRVGQVIGRMEAADNQINIVILDACRDNPFARGWRSLQRGLATISAAEGVLIAYATSPGDVAADGTGRNSPFTAALLRLIRTLDEDVEQLFKQVRAEVSEVTNGDQIPWTASSLIGDFAFFADPSAVQPGSSLPTNSINPQGIRTDFLPRSPATVPCAGSVCEGLPQ